MFNFFKRSKPAPVVPVKTYPGRDIREVWDWRLSEGNPILYCNGPTWIVRVWDNDDKGCLHEWVTDYMTSGIASLTDYETIGKIYEYLRKIRPDYSRPNIEELKPLVAKINATNAKFSEVFKDDNL